MGRPADPTSEDAQSVSHEKRLELRDGAQELGDKDRIDLDVKIELNPRFLLFTPKAGTRQD